MGVPAHLHETVVGGMTLAFMGFAYLLVPLLTRRQLWSQKLASIQAWLYGVGLLVMVLGQTWAGALGVPRRTFEISYGGAEPGGWNLPMNIAGAGVALASAGGALFVVIMVMTLLVGKRTDDPELLVPSALKY
jgi:cytochrome c oxidase subunit I